MFNAMGHSDVHQPGWRQAFIDWAGAALATDDVVAFVAVDSAAGAVSCALGQVSRHAPSPHNPAGLSARISNVVTVPAFRGRGLARGCLEALVEWYRTSTEVYDLNLSATSDGAFLYRSVGFEECEYPSMRLTLP